MVCDRYEYTYVYILLLYIILYILYYIYIILYIIYINIYYILYIIYYIRLYIILYIIYYILYYIHINWTYMPGSSSSETMFAPENGIYHPKWQCQSEHHENSTSPSQDFPSI